MEFLIQIALGFFQSLKVNPSQRFVFALETKAQAEQFNHGHMTKRKNKEQQKTILKVICIERIIIRIFFLAFTLLWLILFIARKTLPKSVNNLLSESWRSPVMNTDVLRAI